MISRTDARMAAIFAGSTAFAAAIGGAFTESSVGTWYPTLLKPSWTPPSAVFGPVWTALYAMMAYAGWRVWRHVGWQPRRLWGFYFGQLALNAAWSALFFGFRQPGWAFAEILVLWLVIVGTLHEFRRVGERVSAALFVPYAAWVGFAAALNLAIWRLQ